MNTAVGTGTLVRMADASHQGSIAFDRLSAAVLEAREAQRQFEAQVGHTLFIHAFDRAVRIREHLRERIEEDR